MVEAQILPVPISFIPFEDRFLARMSGLSVDTLDSQPPVRSDHF
jgi:hypothetical protein